MCINTENFNNLFVKNDTSLNLEKSNNILIPDIDNSFIGNIENKVFATTLNKLLEKNKIEKINFVLTDV